VTLRWAAALAGMLGLALFLAYLHWVGRGAFASPEERHLREVKERATVPASVVPYTFADFAALPHGRPLAEVAALERRGISLEGYLRSAHISSDGDYHLSLTAAAPPSIPVDSLSVTAEVTPQFLRGSSRWSWEQLTAETRAPLQFLPLWPGGSRRVRISGWLLYDFQYDEPYLPRKAPILAKPGRRLTGWEIHPVTRIELWDDSLARFVDYPR
jgi:hypothetical protein